MKQSEQRLRVVRIAAVITVWMGLSVMPAFAQDLLATGQTASSSAKKNDGIPGRVSVDDDGRLKLGLPLQYIDTGATVIDLNTGLEWEKKTNKDLIQNLDDLHDADNVYVWSGNGSQETIWDWLDDINAEQYAGHSDWRLPNIRELESIVHYGKNNPLIDPAFGPTRSNVYWTSSTRKSQPLRAWGVRFGNGVSIVDVKSLPAMIRAVRDSE